MIATMSRIKWWVAFIMAVTWAFSTAYSETGDDIDQIKIIIDSDKFQIAVLSHRYGAEYYTFDTEDIEYHFDKVRISDRIIIDKDAIIIDGEKVSREKLESIIIERDGYAPPFMRIKTGWRHIGSGYDDIKYRKSSIDRWEFSGDMIVDEEDAIAGNAVVVFGDIEVYGKVEGDVMTVYGDVFLDSTAVVEGDVIAVTGDIIANRGAKVYGDYIAGSLLEGEDITRIRFGDEREGDFTPLVGYNRVTGLDLGLKVDFSDKTKELPEISAIGGYTFDLKKWHYGFKFKQQLFDRFASIFGGGFHRLFDSSDEWIIENDENSLAAFLLKEDFYDLYEREGYKVFAEQWLGYNNRFRIAYHSDTYNLLSKNTNWALFGKDKDFRENYSFLLPDSTAIKGMVGEMKSMVVNYELDTRERYHPAVGWFLNLEYERAGHDFGGDFEFERYRGTVQRLQPLTPRQYLNIRLVGGFSDENLPVQKQFFVGGLGTLRGFAYKQFGGDRMVLANVEYVVDFSDEFSGIVFYDVGKAAFGADAFKDEGYHSNMGLALQLEDFLRVNFARPIDEPDDDIVITIRVSIPF